MKNIETNGAPAAAGPYSQAIRSGKTVWVSGQLPVDPASGVLETDIRKATDRCLDNIFAILAATGLAPADCVRLTVYLTDMADFPAMNEAYAARFASPYPARVCLGVSALPKGARIEIACEARGSEA